MVAKFRNRYRIESHRWQYWDYSAPASYFLTINVQDQLCILGQIVNHEMQLSKLGEVVADELQRLPDCHPRIRLDAAVVMPNHLHCVITLDNFEYTSELGAIKPPEYPDAEAVRTYRTRRRKMLIPKAAGKLQMVTSKWVNEIRGTPGVRNWQRSYHDHVIRDHVDYWRIVNYIRNNPRNWNDDIFYR